MSKSSTLAANVFDQPFNEGLVHQVVTAYLAGGRQGSKAQKNRSAVRGGGRKPWRQKGTGRARAGSIRSPLWRGGAMTFAAQPRTFKQKINKKMYRGALRGIFSELVRQERLHVVKEFEINEPKTKKAIEILEKLNLKNVLCVLESVSNNVELATRNLPHIAVCDVKHISPVDLMRFNDVLITEPAVKQVEEW